MSDEEMDLEAIKTNPATQALKRIIHDKDFREQVAKNPEQALASYELSPEVVAALSADAETLSGELSDQQLDAVAAGSEGPPVADEVVARLRTPTMLKIHTSQGAVIAPYVFCRVS